MATGLSNGIATPLQEYFDRMASHWDRELPLVRLECLGNIVKELNIRRGGRVLDVGCGTGVLLPFLVEAVGYEGEVVALDFSKNMLKQAEAKRFQPVVGFIQADAVAIPLPDNLADLAICNSAFPHFGDKAAVLEELACVLKAGGRLVICHTASREAINQLHQSIGGVVAADLLPEEAQLREMVRHAGLKLTYFEDSPRRYLVIAEKSVQAAN